MATLDGTEILRQLSDPFYPECHVRESVTSTFDWLKELERSGAPEGTIVIAERQSAGRGRRGRVWQSPAGGAWFGILLKPKIPVTQSGCISVLSAVAIAQALREHYNRPVEVKWPNDLWLYQKKLGGILSELTTAGNRVESLLLGIGINVNNAVPKDVRIEAISLAETLGHDVGLQDFFAAVLTEFASRYRNFLEHGFELVRTEWERVSALSESIWIEREDQKIIARVRELSSLGKLVVEINGRIEELVADDVTLSLKE
ncbi:biotin--[acetyl-CoA-carboxylase] ligase [Candidatus Acetothermia bacterium]|nr:biotin--[acetyl-CoA-carboxylase] ligase [Candidatus Acetothermia bacterium]MBI3643955.1 biotin--[acetyl-CoA-carboxylase] ligase [Candidatus Acetothermia bacterium]